MMDAPVVEASADAALIDTTAARLAQEEGFRAQAYQDTRGFWTIGFGRCDPGVTPGMTCTLGQATAWMMLKLQSLIGELDAELPWWRKLDPTRQSVLLDMAYNMGVGEAPHGAVRGHGLLSFQRFLANLEAGRFGQAAALMLVSQWAREVGERAERLSILMEHGAPQ